jgi:hypothetical protein
MTRGMKLKIGLTAFVFLFALVAMTSNVQAAFLYADGKTVNELEDNNWEVLLEPEQTADFILQEGELIAGVIKIQELNDVSPGTKDTIDLSAAPDTFTALFLLQVANVGTTTTSTGAIVSKIDFAPAAQSVWDATFGAGGPVDMGGAPTLSSPGTMAFVYDGIAYDDAYVTTTDVADIGASALTFVSGGNLLYEIGFTGNGGSAATDEFWSTIGPDAEFSLALQENNPTNRFALNITQQHNGLGLLPHNFLGADPNFTGPTQIQLKGGFQEVADTSVWPIGTDSNLYVVPIPEPGSFAIMSLLAGIFGLVAIRRRK